MTEYEEILSESILDYNTINGETFTVSLRLEHEIMQGSDDEIEDSIDKASIEESSDEIGTVKGLDSFGIVQNRGSNLETDDIEDLFKNFKDNPFKVEKLNGNTNSIFRRVKDKIRKC